jgi:hypothetical protein
MRTLLIVIVLVVLCAPVHAEIYKWVDEKGTVHFTEDPATIPEKYREKVKSRLTEEDLMTPEERVRAKEQHEEQVRERFEKEQKVYEKSIEEGQTRKKRKVLEDAKEEERLKVEKARKLSDDQKEQKGKEEVKPQPIREPSPKQEKRFECSYCNGKGYIPCAHCNPGGSKDGTPFKGKISKMFVGNARTGPYKKEITCPYCNGMGEKRCSQCNGVGYVWRK